MRRKSQMPGEGAGLRNQIDKDPFYRTNDVLNGVYGKSVRLDAGPDSKTDCKNLIWLNFNQMRSQDIEYLIRKDSEGHNVYQLGCGHEFVGARGKDHKVGKSVPCFKCGGDDAYLSFEHEWSHIIFKSNPHLYMRFVKKYQEQMASKGFNSNITEFTYSLINAFDDLRVTSLWGLVYPGSAHRLADKWQYICEHREDLNHNLIALIYGVALDANNVLRSGGPFSDLIPAIDRTVKMVHGKGAANMLMAIKWFVEECIKIMMQRNQPEPPPQPQPQQGQGEQGAGSQQPKGGQEDGQQPQPSQGSGGDQQGDQPPQQPPSKEEQEKSADAQLASLLKKANEERPKHGKPANQTDAIETLKKNSEGIQKEVHQDHYKPKPKHIANDPKHIANTTALNKIMNSDPGDDIEKAINAGTLDVDIAQSVEKLKDVAAPKDSHQFLLNNTKASVVLIDVLPRDITSSSQIDLSSEDTIHVNRMRAAFARVMGKVRQISDASGIDVDVQSAIQYLLDPSQDDVFDAEEQQKGFYYKVLCDMSGSMSGARFKDACKGSEVLKLALDYPFVRGDHWGFRGSEPRYGSSDAAVIASARQVWMYRYHRDCQGYLAVSANGRGSKGGKKTVPVECGGLTPMHTALQIAVKHTLTHVPSGMEKRLILLTDGKPTQFTTKSKQMGEAFLMGLVHREVSYARQNGIQVYSILIGKGIPDDNAKTMFGPKRFWERVSDHGGSISKALSKIVIREFTKYLRSR